jgi:malate dehydrogenase (oxaloacetate-decarboxylating)
MSNTTSSEGPEGTNPASRPTAGYSLTISLRVDDSDLGRVVGLISATGAEIRSIVSREGEGLPGLRRMHVACSGVAQQNAVRSALARETDLSVEDSTFALHENGKLVVQATAALTGPSDLAMAYTPGVGRVSSAIAENVDLVWKYTGRANAVAVLSNGTAVLGLGDIGPEAAMPVMEGKAVLFKQFANVDAYPVCVRARTVDEMVALGKALAPTFGGINLEDIKAPECFEIEDRLQAELDIPVFHDDQHGTAIVVLAAVQNAAEVVGKKLSDLTVTVVGTGAAGVACAQLLHHVGVHDVIGVDSVGILHAGREGLTPTKQWFVDHGNRDNRTGGVRESMQGADVLLGLSGPGIIDAAWCEEMAKDAIVFAMANPVPEIMPEEIGPNVAVVATGRSDYPNQINNVLAFPGVFRGLLDVRATRCTIEMKLAAAQALADMVPHPVPERIIPGAFEPGVAEAVAAAVSEMATSQGYIRKI